MEYGLINLLACPICYRSLHLEAEVIQGTQVRQGELICRYCNQSYAIRRGVPQMIPTERLLGDKQWDSWVDKQELGLQEYTAPDLEAKAYFDNVAVEFGTFCDLNGTILDIGCGIEPQPAYIINSSNSTYIGLDPLSDDKERTFNFIQGVGECLPFQENAFDWAVSATSLDHFPYPLKVLTEAKRVLKSTGRLGLWVGVVDPDYFRRMYALPHIDDKYRARLWTQIRQCNLKWLVGAMWRHLVVNRVRSVKIHKKQKMNERNLIDQVFAERAAYHFHFYTEAEVIELLKESNFQIIKHRIITHVTHGNSLFVLAAPN